MKDASSACFPAQRDLVCWKRERKPVVNTIRSGTPKVTQVGCDGYARYSAGVFTLDEVRIVRGVRAEVVPH